MRALVLLVTGCGRVAFEPPGSTDALADDCPGAIGHNEDVDFVDDGCDLCPHVYELEPGDADGDGVGDSCDPDPAVPRERIVFFDGFGTLEPEWEVRGTSAISELRDDFYFADARNQEQLVLVRNYTPGRDTFVVGGRFGAASPTGARQIAAAFSAVAAPGAVTYYCELYGNDTTTRLGATQHDGNVYTGNNAPVALPPLENEAFTLTLAHVPSVDYRCATTWGIGTTIANTIPGWTANAFSVFGGNFELAIDYVLQIRTE